MIVNYIPGEECRVAIVEDGRLEELHAERANAVSFVGNIYVGRVTNVEPSIQAAFVDFGLESNGFLHISDVHPRYFPGEDDDATEQIGKKTPRRERPPIQHCFRKGQEVLVQVLKEGINTKGPTLTSYLSIPGRYLVMLPDMDRVGVSRKVEDEDLRREMKKTLDQIELPEGFGFILRTAGEGRGKLELKRDLAYLQRLWKDIERRRKGGSQPRLLYAESDLLMRALRDIWTSEISEIIIDNEAALNRAARFMKIVAPRSATKLLHYNRTVPLFHAYGLEEQITRTHAREVPLPSGGSLVIDETEAMVAIDVNSGKMRSHGDAETTAYKTNIEAVDEICRQLRLRDVGGLVLCDLIDMMKRDHRRDIENRFKDRMKRDRAATKVLPISQFGIVEMTRQRQKGSLRATHYAKCPTCTGRGMLKRPDSVADDAMRDLAALLEHDKVHKVELVVSPRVASELLSHKRQHLGRLEYHWKKHVDVRVSEDIPADRVAFYAYESSGADVDLERLPRAKTPKDLPVWADLSGVGEDWTLDTSREEAIAAPPEALIAPDIAGPIDELILSDDLDGPMPPLAGDGDDQGDRGPGGRRRRRRGGRGRNKRDGAAPAEPGNQPPRQHAPAPHAAAQPSRAPDNRGPADDGMGPAPGMGGEEGGGRKRRRRRRRRGGAGAPAGGPEFADNGAGAPAGAPGTPIDEGDLGPDDQLDAPHDNGTPRGDSWDIPVPLAGPPIAPTAIRPRAPRPAPVAPPARANVDDADERDDAPPRSRPPVTPRDSDDADLADDGFVHASDMRDAGDADDADDTSAGESRDRDDADRGDEPAGDNTGEPGTEGGGRRRRRRRRRGGKGGSGGEGGRGESAPAEGPAPAARPQAGPPSRSGSRPAPGPGPASRPAPEPKPAARPAPKPPAAPALPPVPTGGPSIVPPRRSLYGTRRKLKPGEVPTKRED
jgi:ribonuclease E